MGTGLDFTLRNLGDKDPSAISSTSNLKQTMHKSFHPRTGTNHLLISHVRHCPPSLNSTLLTQHMCLVTSPFIANSYHGWDVGGFWRSFSTSLPLFLTLFEPHGNTLCVIQAYAFSICLSQRYRWTLVIHKKNQESNRIVGYSLALLLLIRSYGRAVH